MEPLGVKRTQNHIFYYCVRNIANKVSTQCGTYDKIRKDIGDFVIERDDNMEFFAGKYKNSPTMQLALPITPLTNFLFVLPAWTYHSVETNREKHDRISIAINFVQPGQPQQQYG